MKKMGSNRIRSTAGEKVFYCCNYLLLTLLAFISLVPIVNVLAVSLSSKYATGAGQVFLWPVEFTLSSYEYVMRNATFMAALLNSFKRVLVGVPLNVLLVVMCSYPLSMRSRDFPGRTFFSWFFMLSMIFSGGLIPTFLTIQMVGLMDSFWVLIIPLAMPVYYMVLMRNFFRVIPHEMTESARIDGAGHWTILWRIHFPLSITAVATITLLCFIMHWNAWFDGLLYIGNPMRQPLQTYLQTVLARPLDVSSLAKSPEQWKIVQQVSDRTVKSAQIFIATIPIIIIYPFAQRYFTKGLLIGAVKG